MGRTGAGSKGQDKSALVFEILKRPDGSFDVFRNAELADSHVPDRWLEDQLIKYGICGKEYRDVRKELEESGKVRLEFGS